MSSIYFFESTPDDPARLLSAAPAADSGRGRREVRPNWFSIFLIWLALAIPSLSAAMVVIRLLMESLPPLSPAFPVLLLTMGLAWLLYLVPTIVSVVLVTLRSPRAIFFWRFSAGASLAITAMAGLALSTAEPMILDKLWVWLAQVNPAMVIWLNHARLWAVPPLVSGVAMAVLLGLNAIWLVRLCRSGRIAVTLGCVKPPLPVPPPAVSLFSDKFQARAKNGAKLMSTALVVYLIMIIYIDLCGLVSMVSRFFFLRPYLEQQSFLGFIFNDFGFHLILALVPLVAAVFGLASSGRVSRRRGPLPVALLVICLMALYSLVSSGFSLINFYSQLPQLLLAVNIIWPIFYLAVSIFFLVKALK